MHMHTYTHSCKRSSPRAHTCTHTRDGGVGGRWRKGSGGREVPLLLRGPNLSISPSTHMRFQLTIPARHVVTFITLRIWVKVSRLSVTSAGLPRHDCILLFKPRDRRYRPRPKRPQEFTRSNLAHRELTLAVTIISWDTPGKCAGNGRLARTPL